MRKMRLNQFLESLEMAFGCGDGWGLLGKGGGCFEKGVKIHLKEEINKKAKSLKFSASALTRLFRLSLNFKWRQLSFVRTPLTPASV